MTREQLIKAHINQMWENSSALFKTLIIAIPVGLVVLVVLWGVLLLIQTKCSPDSKVVRIIKERKKWILGFGFYASLMVQMGIFSRPFGSTRIVKWIPFNVPGGEYLVFVYALANLVIFIPFGILVPKVFRGVNTVWKMALVTFITSVCIELIQYVLACGYSEVEDVIMNVAGGVIGYLIIKFIEKRKNEKRERVEN